MYVLIGFSLVFAIGFLAAFIYSVIHGQFDDDYTPSVRILFDKPNSASDNPKP
ncbi:MAG: cbb3-type cytochrome oxidase assembly protein CcoS [Chitinophagales bacterium]|nr:cbb3-type cytochrome oxidase assembly protein CcoS [Chitinophagales bacterium]MDW8418998.1 cbb3-type cytochrome oxidase assembly protein CcoS [Chitinophagales bacterium]